MRIISNYTNGNYKVKLFNDGTKIRTLPDGEDDFNAEFPENIDVKISNKCSIGCAFCHENSTCNGKIADGLENPFYLRATKSPDSELSSLEIVSLNENLNNFVKSLKQGTELAVGGGALSEIGEGLFEFLLMLRRYNIIPNITVNGKELLNDDFFANLLCRINMFRSNWSIADSYLNNNKVLFDKCHVNRDRTTCIHGLGISYVDNSEIKERMLALNRIFPHAVVIHTIYGITTKKDYDWLAENNFKVLVLGYKNFRRGSQYLESHSDEISKNMEDFDNNFNYYVRTCKRLSFDCLATEQFKLKDKIPEDVWNLRYMGDDGKFTMYVDLVNGKFAMNSTTPEEKRFNCSDFGYDASLMFNKIKNN